MPRKYTHVQEVLPSIVPMKDKGYIHRQIAEQMGLEQKQIENLWLRERRKQRRIANGYIPRPKWRPRKMPETQEIRQNNELVTLRMKVELLQNFLFRMWKDVRAK